ncbi:MAG: VVA0879 family protein [Myxococcota bacterium]
MTRDEWHSKGVRLFGEDQMAWRFKCPACGHVATPADYKDAGAPSSAVAFSCVGRWLSDSKEAFKAGGTGPCTYAGGGLFRMNPVEVDGAWVFEFAEEVPDAI